MNSISSIQTLNARELSLQITGTSSSWHETHRPPRGSTWIYFGNLPTNLNEGDVMVVFSQFGEVDDLHLVRDDLTGICKGFGFLKYCVFESCVLAVDNLGGTTVIGRSLRVEHCDGYTPPEAAADAATESKDDEGEGENSDVTTTASMLIDKTRGLKPSETGGAGHAYEGVKIVGKFRVDEGVDMFGYGGVVLNRDDDNDDEGEDDSEGEEEEGKGGGGEGKKRKRKKTEKKSKKNSKDKDKKEKKRKQSKHSNSDSDSNTDSKHKSAKSSKSSRSSKKNKDDRKHSTERVPSSSSTSSSVSKVNTSGASGDYDAPAFDWMGRRI